MNGIVNESGVVRANVNVRLGAATSTSHYDDISPPRTRENRGVLWEIDVILEEYTEDMAPTALDDDNLTVVYIRLRRGSSKDDLDGGEVMQRVAVSEDLGGIWAGFEC